MTTTQPVQKIDSEDFDRHRKIKNTKRRYKRMITNLASALQSELEHIDQEDFEPYLAIDTEAFRLIQEVNRLRALLENK